MQHYLSVSPMSVTNERLFSAAGDLCSDQHMQLALEMLLFICVENFKYFSE